MRLEFNGPPEEMTLNPATLPLSAVDQLEGMALVIISPFTVSVAYPNPFSSRLIPKAVTTTSFNCCDSSASFTFMVLPE